MTRTVDGEVPERGSTPSNVICPDVAARNENYNSSTSEMSPEFSNKLNPDFEHQSSKQKTNEMTNFMDDLSLNSPKERLSRSRSSTKSIKRRTSRSSSSSSSSSSSGHSSWSRSRSSSHDSRSYSRESRSASRGRKYRPKRSRRHSRSYSYGRSNTYSRSRSRSCSPRQRRRYCSTYRRYYRSPPRYRSRSGSHSRSHHRSRYSRSRSRSHGRRYYGFVRRHYSPTYRSWRGRSRSRSRGRSLHLSDKEKMDLLEIAKMNASKILGKQVELPESLKRNLELKSSAENDKQSGDKSRSGSSSRDSETLLQESRGATEVQTEIKHRSPYALWRPVTSEAKTFSKGLSPKEQHKSRNR